MALVNGGFLHYTDMKKLLKNLLLNRWSDFDDNFTEMSLERPFSEIVMEILICH